MGKKTLVGLWIDPDVARAFKSFTMLKYLRADKFSIEGETALREYLERNGVKLPPADGNGGTAKIVKVEKAIRA